MRCEDDKRETINGEDIIFALSTKGFDNYVTPLKLYLQKYREAVKVRLKLTFAILKDKLLFLGGETNRVRAVQYGG